MSLYIGREASKFWKRICTEASTEIALLGENWKYILGGLIFQELGQEKAYMMDFSSFLLKEQENLYCFDMVQGTSVLSCLSNPEDNNFLFDTATRSKLSLPGIPRGVLYGCGDLIFSSHVIFSLVFVRTFHKYGTHRFVKNCSWLTVVAQSLLIIASRKHYTVDVVVAWYTVNLVVFFVDKKLPDADILILTLFLSPEELPDRSSGSTSQLLPLSKDTRIKDEHHRPLSGSSGDSSDWVQKHPSPTPSLVIEKLRPRIQINGRNTEEGHNESDLSSA
ncbi:hypothetical protein SASPL_104004 [Salvia splendens]|uniref:Sphingomyelin synthase-like domain-containing protein n=1 Tax=Salvia splendens TaxID=180675 RepID=A0A8X8YGS5_SALSN|nr:hypothetical protein SASPL_104004 [Salvia splendens]